jgi:hypothetical protein
MVSAKEQEDPSETDIEDPDDEINEDDLVAIDLSIAISRSIDELRVIHVSSLYELLEKPKVGPFCFCVLYYNSYQI